MMHTLSRNVCERDGYAGALLFSDMLGIMNSIFTSGAVFTRAMMQKWSAVHEKTV